MCTDAGFIYEGDSPYVNGIDDLDNGPEMAQFLPETQYLAEHLKNSVLETPSPSKRRRRDEDFSGSTFIEPPCSGKENVKLPCPNEFPKSLSYEGYTYSRNTHGYSKTKTQWSAWYQCTHKRSKKCFAALQVYIKDGQEDFVRYKLNDKPHCCPPISKPFQPVPLAEVPLDVRAEMKHTLETRACVPGAPNPKDLAVEIVLLFQERYNDRAYSGYTVDQLRRLYHRIRETEFANWAQAICIHPLVCASDTDERLFLQFHNKVNVQNRLLTLIGWGHPDLIWEIKDGSLNFFFDLTFHVVPRGFDQCFIIMAYLPRYDYYVPVFYILVQSKLQEVYEHALLGVIAAMGHKIATAKTKTCDFESGLINAIEEHFPEGDMVGCEFHFKQANRRKLIADFHLPKDLVSEFMREDGLFEILTVVPPDDIDETIGYIRQKSPLQAAHPVKMDKFWTYFRSQWCRESMIPRWNIYDIASRENGVDTIINRTNNPLERHNRELKEMFPAKNPPMEIFVQNIRKMSNDKVTMLQLIKSGKAKPPAHLGFNLHQIPDDLKVLLNLA